MFNPFKKKPKQEEKAEIKTSVKENKVTKPIKEEKPKLRKAPNKNIKKGLFGFYDDIVSNLLSQKEVAEPDTVLASDQLSVEWGRLISQNYISVFYVIENYDNWVPLALFSDLRNFTLANCPSVTMNYYMDIKPHTIDWNSPRMRQYVRVNQRRIENDTVDRDNIFTQRENFHETEDFKNKIQTLKYYDDIDLRYRRHIFRTNMFIQLTGNRDYFEEFYRAVQQFDKATIACKVKCVRLGVDVFDWMRSYLPTSMRVQDFIKKKTPIQVMSDDTITCLQSSMQGIIGERGIPLGSDVYSALPVLHTFREDKDKAENILITAQTGGGKSVFVKNLLYWLYAYNYKICILDYEGDEYTNIADTLNVGKPGSAVIIDMSAGNGNYFDPLMISQIAMSDTPDLSAKAEAIKYTKAMFTIMIGGQMDKMEDSIISEVITRVYSEHGIEDNPKTWGRSRQLNIRMIYDTLNRLYEERIHFIDKSGDNARQIKARDLLLTLSKYFVPGESEYGTFKNPLKAEDLWKADCVIFSFGNKGQSNIGADNVKSALKQLCVSKVSNDLSNYNKFVENKFTVKVWEEVQRFVDVPGAQEIMTNCITGGRKRGDIAFIITNNLQQLLDARSDFMKALKDNLQGVCVGYIKTESTREQFCKEFNMELFKSDLDDIARATGDIISKDENGSVKDSPFRSSFLVKMDATSKSPSIQAVVKAMIHPALFENNVFRNGKLNVESLEKEF